VEGEFKSINTNNIPFIDEKEVLKMWDEFKVGKFYYQSLIWRFQRYRILHTTPFDISYQGTFIKKN
jgi:hypothetical protein